MGNRMSAELSEQVDLDLRISQALERDSMTSTGEIKFAMGGLDFAGKKTIFRQLKSTFDEHYRQENPAQFLPLIHENIIIAMKNVVAGVRRLHDYKVT